MAAKTVMLGRNVSFTIAGITINASTGAITVATPVALTGKAKRASLRNRYEVERIDSLDTTIANFVSLGISDWEVTLSAIKFKAGTNPNELQATFLAGAYAQIVITTPLQTFTYQGVIRDWNWDVGGPGETLDEVTLIPFDTGAANPAVA